MNINQEDFSEPQIKVIKAICIHQLDSLNRILSNNDKSGEDLVMLLIENDVTREEFNTHITKEITKFEELYNNPEDLRVLSKKEISMFRHLLSNLEPGITEKYPNAVKNLWQRLHIIEEVQGNIYTSNQMN